MTLISMPLFTLECISVVLCVITLLYILISYRLQKSTVPERLQGFLNYLSTFMYGFITLGAIISFVIWLSSSINYDLNIFLFYCILWILITILEIARIKRVF